MKRLILLLSLAGLLAAHDLEENRATLVLRDGTHLSLTLYLNYTETLWEALLPQREFGVFLLSYSSLKLDDLQKELVRAQKLLESGVQVHTKGAASGLRITNWVWPDAKTVQALLQKQVMQAVVEGHVHQPPLEVRAEAVATSDIGSVTVRFPKEFQKVLVVSYRPNQAWAEPGTSSPEIKF